MVAGVAGPQRPFDVEELRTNGMIRLDIAFHGRLGTLEGVGAQGGKGMGGGPVHGLLFNGRGLDSRIRELDAACGPRSVNTRD
jgi:hypothetical protein